MDFERRFGNPPAEKELADFQTCILEYYRIDGRSFPWRTEATPYGVVVSEIMLQQTQTHRVEPKYLQWMEAVPDFRSLAELSTDRLLGLWQGLGYNRRALALREIAGKVITEYDGVLPDDPAELTTFPGIGPATASSICAFAFNAPVVFIETNIRRVFIHFFFGDDAEGVSDRELLPLVEETLYRESPRDWYNALMDIGTLLKTVVPNPNRRSRHYVRQAAFEGSNRQARGAILKVLQNSPPRDLRQLSLETGIEPERIEKAAEELCSEGFIAAEKGKYGLQG